MPVHSGNEKLVGTQVWYLNQWLDAGAGRKFFAQDENGKEIRKGLITAKLAAPSDTFVRRMSIGPSVASIWLKWLWRSKPFWDSILGNW